MRSIAQRRHGPALGVKQCAMHYRADINGMVHIICVNGDILRADEAARSPREIM